MRLLVSASVALALTLQGCAGQPPQPAAPAPAREPGAAESVRIYEGAQVEEQPVLIPRTCPPLDYPEQLRRAGVTEGRVVFNFVIDAGGRVDPATVAVVTASHSAFAMAARPFVLKCRYRPGSIGGQAVPVRFQQPVDFKFVGRIRPQ